MIFTFKTLGGQAFELDCDQSLTVSEIKKRIAEEKGVNDFPVDFQRLIYGGKILKDEDKMVDLKYDETKFVVVMIAKATIPVPVPTPKTSEPTSDVIAEKTSSDTPQDSTSIAANADKVPSSDLIAQLESMGYPRDESIRALEAAHNDVNLAVEFLVNGLQDMQSDTGSDQQGNLDFLRDNAVFNQIRQMIRNDPSQLPAIIQELGGSNPALMNLINDNQDEFLRILNEPASGHNASLVQGQQSAAQPASGQNASLVQGQQPAVQPLQQPVVILSESDRDAVNRIKDLGFSEMQVIEAYIACEKNEMLAANYLFTQMEQDQQQGGNQGAGN